MTDMRNACYKCEYRQDTAGSAHSRCVHPLTKSLNEDPLANAFAIFASVSRVDGPSAEEALAQLSVTADEKAIDKGWFIWPWSFDPTWLRTCDGFTSNEVVENE